ncbi:hypothetical protein EEL30_00190 (plasmid) [Brevibacillus laterosporus]|uniref:Uncharacterized protein n=1 Tax=Brevibacillus laterosporus TaxID=1465 RepID=A0A518V217_BRELA|nr:hypothetical protein EEL30_00190 [Brevibacillus laterosporus]
MDTEAGFSSKSALEIRLIMKEQGWDSRDTLCTTGWKNGYVYSVWFERYDWHGRNTLGLTGHHVCFHKHTNNLKSIDEITKCCAEQALKAFEEYLDCVPFQNANGETAKDIMLGDWNNPKVLINKPKKE